MERELKSILSIVRSKTCGEPAVNHCNDDNTSGEITSLEGRERPVLSFLSNVVYSNYTIYPDSFVFLTENHFVVKFVVMYDLCNSDALCLVSWHCE